MIVFDNITKKFVILEDNNDSKNYYDNIIHTKYNINITKNNIETSKIIKDKIKKLY